MTRFANPKAIQDFIDRFGSAAAAGGNTIAGAKPRVNPRQVTPGVSNPTGGPLIKPPLVPPSTPKPGTKPPTVMPAGMNPNFKGFGIGSKMKNGGKVSSASKRADGCATKGKTKGTMR